MNHDQVRFIAEFAIKDGKADEFKKLVQAMSRAVQDGEPGTVEYQFYLNQDETRCVVHETYANSVAVLAHNEGSASQTILPEIFRVSSLGRFDVYGNPSEELQKVLASFGPQVYHLIAGFSR